MNKPNGSRENWLQPRTPATKTQILARIAALEFHCPVYARLTDEGREVWLETLCADLKHKTDAELEEGCRRYRQDPKNRWFPTPGQLLEACKNPFDSKPRNYAPLDDLPAAMPQKDAEALVARISAKYKIGGASDVSLTKLKEEILARPPIPFVPMTPERKAELLANLERRLADEGFAG